MTCVDHAESIEDCVACHGRWDRAMAERAIDGYGIGGIAAATIRMAIAEIDRQKELDEEADWLDDQRAKAVNRVRELAIKGRSLEHQREADLDEAAATYATMRAEIEALRCYDVDAFHDGELSTERADAFRLHLGTCVACESALHDRMQVSTMVSSAVDRQRAVVDAAVAWVTADGSITAIVAAVDELEGR